MRKCVRGDAPEFLREHFQEFQSALQLRLASSPPRGFFWPSRGGINLQDVVLLALIDMTQRRCSYCDADAINATGIEEIDHFRPKSSYPEVAYAWTNMYLSCSACNRSKQERWSVDLLAPDLSEYEFERFFFYETTTGKIVPNSGASIEDQRKAEVTIALLDLNRAAACSRRRWTVQTIRRRTSDEELQDLGYRFLIPLFSS